MRPSYIKYSIELLRKIIIVNKPQTLLPPILVDTWIQILKYDDYELEQRRFVIKKWLNYYFGSIELAQLYVEQCRSRYDKAS